MILRLLRTNLDSDKTFAARRKILKIELLVGSESDSNFIGDNI